MTQREVRFLITDHRDDGRFVIDVYPSVNNIYKSEGGEEILIAIAANCLRAVAKTSGLERAIERFSEAAVKRTKIIRDKWPWE